MTSKTIRVNLIIIGLMVAFNACKIPAALQKEVHKDLPVSYNKSTDSSNVATMNWRNYFKDAHLIALIDTALQNNQELNIVLHEIEISKNEIMARKGEYKPFVNLSAGSAIEKSGGYTFNGMAEDDLRNNGSFKHKFVGDQSILANFSWELDIWKKLRNAKESAVRQYLGSIEGKRFVITNLVAEVANAYYELLVLDKQLEIVNQNIQLQKDALEMVKVQKEAARVNQLAVNRFEAQLINTENLQYEILQSITETENKINFLLARNPQTVTRGTMDLDVTNLMPFAEGVPSQLLANRADIRQAEQQLEASKLDIKVAKANFYPSFTLRSGIGLQSFNPVYLINPKSLAFNIMGDMMAPLVNRNAIKAAYYNASEKQIQAAFRYEQTILNAHVEVMNQLAGNENYSKSYLSKLSQVNILNQSVDISNSLFKSARADYTEVLLTQREALEAKMDLMEIKSKQLQAEINTYKVLGGGWQ